MARFVRLAPYGATGRFFGFIEHGVGAAAFDVAALGDAASVVQGMGAAAIEFFALGEYESATVQPGLDHFDMVYGHELKRRERERSEREKLEAETRAIEDTVARDIGLLLRQQEVEDERRAELKRLRGIAQDLGAEQLGKAYGERASKALQRAVDKGNHSALEALEREIERSMEEEEFLILAMTMHTALND